MGDRSSWTACGGACFLVVLTLAFVALKLLGKVAWSWWWVLSPLLLPVATALAIATVVAVIVIAALLTLDPKGGRQ